MAGSTLERPPVTPNTPYDELPEWLDVPDYMAYAGIKSRTTVYDHVRRALIPSRRFGRQVRIPKYAVNSAVK